MAETIKCRNCGAIIEKNIDACPYCGEINYEGAEQQYMEHLGTIRSSLENLSSEGVKEVQSEFKDAGKILLRSFIIITTVMIIGGGILWLALRSSDAMVEEITGGSSMYRSATIWLSDNEEKLNEMYDREDFDGILEMTSDCEYERGNGFRYWYHYDFMTYYKMYADFKSREGHLNKDNPSAVDVGQMLYDVISLETLSEETYIFVNDYEIEKINEYAMELHYFYEEYLGITKDSEIDALIEEMAFSNGNYYVSEYECRDYVEGILENSEM